MLSLKQRTVKQAIKLSGIGLHSGKTLHLNIIPASENFGIQFCRVDLPQKPMIPAHANQIHSTDLNTTIAVSADPSSPRVATIEHLMAAFAGLEIDNVLVEINGPEIPVMDGSAAPFVEAILDVGITEQNAKRSYYIVKDTFELRQADKWIRIEPARYTSYEMAIDFRSQVIGQQSLRVDWTSVEALESIFLSRTFCHVNDVNAMRKAGLALGGSLENAIVVSDSEVMNPEGLRFDDEFVRHKMLDCIGDLTLMGAPLIGKITAYKSGHGLHAAFMKALWQIRLEKLTLVEPERPRENNPPISIAHLA
jgi:UDP-3-O-[3-hydroxymyristoyl] N-acetylglucosamine deacetylase